MLRELEEVQVRPGTEADPAALTDLHHHDARETAVTLGTAAFTAEPRRPWLHSHPEDGPHGLLVACPGEGITGYTTSRPFHPIPAARRAYARVGIPVYVLADDHDERGVVTVLTGPDPGKAVYDDEVRVAYGTAVTVPAGPAKGFVIDESITGALRDEA
ncbi:hypothetical protein [Streptomyces sp. NPDC041003]|uniref:GNAT family N-acetyltransferase n=1 Tax=Streptomyces sp. NPDC041003 TaxID=3155730 RepID=UPI0033D9B8F5